MTTLLPGRLAVLGALSGEVSLLSGDVEIRDAGRRPVGLSESVRLRFGPAIKDWQVTGFAIHAGGERLLVEPLDRTITVYAGQNFELTITARVSDD